MNPEKIIYDKFIKPFVGKSSKNIGVELEFPLINKNGRDIDLSYVAAICDYLENCGFRCVLTGIHGEKLFMENDKGDCLSFDNSYNNFEFSLSYGDNLLDIYKRFNEYYEIVQEYLLKENHTLCGRGSNPNYENIAVHHAPFSTYNMVQNFLHAFKGEHNYCDFPAFMSSVQTHLDTDEKTLPRAYTFFSKIDFLRGIMFHNSPDFENKGFRIFRDYLWAKSGFGRCSNITGTVDIPFETTDDIIKFFLEKGMFNRLRSGEYEIFEPVAIKDYFTDSKYGALPEDIDCYLSFCNVEITSRGTLEVRSDCTQKEGRFFLPPAINLGLMTELEKADRRIDKFIADNEIKLSPSDMRKIVAEGKSLDLIANESEISSLVQDMTDIARCGLKSRGKGEEILLV